MKICEPRVCPDVQDERQDVRRPNNARLEDAKAVVRNEANVLDGSTLGLQCQSRLQDALDSLGDGDSEAKKALESSLAKAQKQAEGVRHARLWPVRPKT